MAVPQEDTQQREQEAIELRVTGHSYREISHKLGFSGPGSAYKALRRAMRKLPVPDVGETRALEITRAETLFSMAWKKAEADGWTPIWFKIILEIVDRLHRLGGLFPIAAGGNGAPQTTILDVLTDRGFLAWIEKKNAKPVAPAVVDVVAGAVEAGKEIELGKVVGLRRRLPHAVHPSPVGDNFGSLLRDPESTPRGAESSVGVQALADRGAATPPVESVPETDEAVRADSRASDDLSADSADKSSASSLVNGNGDGSTCACCFGIGCGQCRTRGGGVDEC